jgi:hypothetical protein
MSGATTRATAPVAAEIIAGRPPVNAMVTAIVNEANNPSRGSTPAMIENDTASGINASATTSLDNASTRNTRGDSQEGRETRAGSDIYFREKTGPLRTREEPHRRDSRGPDQNTVTSEPSHFPLSRLPGCAIVCR